jgi:hypothetical protein
MTPNEELRERATELAIQIHGGVGDPKEILATAFEIEAYLSNGQPCLTIASALCACGHALSWHAKRDGAGFGRGCQCKNLKHSDLYGYCPCPVSA